MVRPLGVAHTGGGKTLAVAPVAAGQVVAVAQLWPWLCHPCPSKPPFLIHVYGSV
jgi:hypothetical protein